MILLAFLDKNKKEHNSLIGEHLKSLLKINILFMETALYQSVSSFQGVGIELFHVLDTPWPSKSYRWRLGVGLSLQC